MNTVRQLRILYGGCFAANILLAVLGEQDTFVNVCPPDSRLAFTLEIVSIAATLAALPVAAKLRGATRIGLVHLCCAVVIVCYYLTLSSSSASTSSMLCLAIVACAMLYCWPNGRTPQGENGKTDTRKEEENSVLQVQDQADNKMGITSKP